MTTFYIPVPKDAREQQLLNGLMNSLEHSFAAQTITVIGVVSDDPRLEPLLKSMARDVVGDTPAENAPVKKRKPRKPAKAKEEPSIEMESPAPVIPTSLTGLGEKICLECGQSIPLERRKSSFCSQKCYTKSYLKTNAKSKKRDGDGIAKGALVR